MLPSNCLFYSRLILVCNTRMSGYIPKHRQPLAGGALTDVPFSCWLHLESASPSSCCPFFGTCWLSGTLQCSCFTTAWFQSHQARSGFPNRICTSVLVQGYVGGRDYQSSSLDLHFGTSPYCLCSFLEVLSYILLLIITFHYVCLMEMNLMAAGPHLTSTEPTYDHLPYSMEALSTSKITLFRTNY